MGCGRVYKGNMTFSTFLLLCIAAALFPSVAALRAGAGGWRRADAGGTAPGGAGVRSSVHEAKPERAIDGAAGATAVGRGPACEAVAPRRGSAFDISTSNRADVRAGACGLRIDRGFHRVLVHAAQGFGQHRVLETETEIPGQIGSVADQIRA